MGGGLPGKPLPWQRERLANVTGASLQGAAACLPKEILCSPSLLLFNHLPRVHLLHTRGRGLTGICTGVKEIWNMYIECHFGLMTSSGFSKVVLGARNLPSAPGLASLCSEYHTRVCLLSSASSPTLTLAAHSAQFHVRRLLHPSALSFTLIFSSFSCSVLQPLILFFSSLSSLFML